MAYSQFYLHSILALRYKTVIMNRLLIFTALTCLFVLSSCEKTEKVDNFPKHTSLMVANCFFSPDTPFIFKLSKSLSPIDNAPFKAQSSPSAYIKIFENNVFFDSFRVDNSSNPSFKGTKIPEANNTYRFECHYPGFKTIYAEDFLPDTLALIKASGYYTVKHSYDTNDTLLTGEFSTNINLDFNAVKTVNQNLIITITGNIVKRPLGSIGGYYSYNSMLYNVQDLNSNNQSEFINSQLFVNNPDGIKKLNIKWDNPYSRLHKSGPSFDYTITVITCSNAAFEYLKRQSLQIENFNDPFSQPTPISNNILNGYGIFGGINTTHYIIQF